MGKRSKKKWLEIVKNYMRTDKVYENIMGNHVKWR